MADAAPRETNQTPPTGVTTRAQRAQGAGAGNGGDGDGTRNASDELNATLQQQLNVAQVNAAATAAELAELRRAHPQVAPPDNLDISKVLKAARFVKKLDGTVRSA